jgi:hypothetical protein
MKQVDNYRGVAEITHGKGDTMLFWSDNWEVNGSSVPMCRRYPRLFSYVIDEDVSVLRMTQNERLDSIFALPLSVEAFQEWQEITHLVSTVSLSEQRSDQRTFVWGSKFTPSKFYNFLFAQLVRDVALNAIWKSRALPKLKVFVWLLFWDRLNTRDIMQRKHWHIDSGYECELCMSNTLETSQHLFLYCDFARQCWDFLHIQWDASLDLKQNFVAARSSFSGPCFFEVFACAAWNIWKARNDLVFNNIPSSLARWKVGFQSDLLLHRYKVKQVVIQPLVAWISSLFL